MSDIRFCLLFGTVCFIAGNTVATRYWQTVWRNAALVFWLLGMSIGSGE